ncbi:MAG: hypothetical protein ABIR96_11190 [Bdellovibrionota bacterium]
MLFLVSVSSFTLEVRAQSYFDVKDLNDMSISSDPTRLLKPNNPNNIYAEKAHPPTAMEVQVLEQPQRLSIFYDAIADQIRKKIGVKPVVVASISEIFWSWNKVNLEFQYRKNLKTYKASAVLAKVDSTHNLKFVKIVVRDLAGKVDEEETQAFGVLKGTHLDYGQFLQNAIAGKLEDGKLTALEKRQGVSMDYASPLDATVASLPATMPEGTTQSVPSRTQH